MRSLIVKTLPLATLLALLPACQRADAPGTAHDTKVEKKETVKRNAQGDVTEHEKKDEAK